jgi:predicted transcriptional regulator
MNQEQAYKINQNTIEIAQNTSKYRATLYVYVALVNFIYNGKMPSIAELSAEIEADKRTVKRSIEWLRFTGYIKCQGDYATGMHYEIL